MKICDGCGQQDGKHTEVGGVAVEIKGYHHRQHTPKPWFWNIDLCPKCASKLKDEVEAAINRARGNYDRGAKPGPE